MKGRPIKNHFVYISKSISIGDQWIELDKDVSGDWNVGDRIFIGPTGFFFDEAETFEIRELIGNRIKLSSPATYKHYGELETYDAKWKVFTLDERAEVALLSRNIQLSPRNQSQEAPGVQIMATESSVLNLEYIEINFGGNGGVLGRYPIHFHILWNTKGQLVRGCSISRSKNRCITVHSTNEVLIEENVCFDITGHAFFLENAVEVGNVFRRNLGMLIRKGTILKTDSQPTTFWITNANNSFEGNVASGSANTCFWYLANTVALNENSGLDIKPYLAPWGRFINNTAHTCRVGLRFDEGIHPVSNDFTGAAIDPFKSGKNFGPRVPIEINGSVFHHCYDMGVWATLMDNVDFTCHSCIAADNRLSFRYSSHQKLRNSLVVGLSKNYQCSKDFYWHNDGTSTARAQCLIASGLHLYMGYAMYDGPSDLDLVHFANFYGYQATPKSFGFMHLMAAIKSTANLMSRISFSSNVPYYARVDLTEVPSSSMWTTQIIDEDGSVSGIPNSFIIPEILTKEEASRLHPLNHAGYDAYNGKYFQWDKNFNLPPQGDSGNCVRFGNETHFARSWICNQRMGLLVVFTGGSLQDGSGNANINLTRSDGYKVTDQFRDGANFPYHTSVYLNRTSISYGMETSKRVSQLRLRMMDSVPEDFVIFRADDVTASSNYHLFTSTQVVRLIPLNSMDSLNNCKDTCVFFNGTIGSAWIKLVAKPYTYNRDFGQFRGSFKYNGVAQVIIDRRKLLML